MVIMPQIASGANREYFGMPKTMAIPKVGIFHQVLAAALEHLRAYGAPTTRLQGFSQIGTSCATLVASAGPDAAQSQTTNEEAKPMTTFRNFSAPIISAAAALTLSFMSISNTVSTPAVAAQPMTNAAAPTAPANSADVA
jgi:hypothetical protein